VKGFRPRPNANPAEGVAGKASDLQSPVRREAQPEQREQHRHQLSRVRRRINKSMVVRRRDDRVRKQILPVVGRNRFRRRGTNKDRSVSGSARRHLLAQLSPGNLAEVQRREFISRSRLRLMQDVRMKRAPNEKECRALVFSRLRHNSTSSRSSSSNEVARLRELTAARDSGSRKVGSKDNQKKRLRHGRNNFGAITPAAPK
jgi:hypothetical protein